MAGARYAYSLPHHAISPPSAAAAVRGRLVSRTETFLQTAERTIFAHQASPYRPLLDDAGYDFTRFKALVMREGIEPALRVLRERGVYFTIEESKGFRDVQRHGRTYRLAEGAFDNPLVQSGLEVLSGGSRSAGLRSLISADNLRLGAEHLSLALSAYGLQGQPIIVWLPGAHAASLWFVLALAASGNTPRAWFSPTAGFRGILKSRAYRLGLHAAAFLYRVRLPSSRTVPIGQEQTILRWLLRIKTDGPYGIVTTPSSALRLALAAKSDRIGLPGATFITIGEPLTPMKQHTIQSVGGRAFSSLGFTEFGRATYGCASPAAGDDAHVCRDAVAVIQHRRVVDRLGTEVDALLFTSLLPDARRVLLNVETGDYAALAPRRCGCPLEALGWTDHLQDIRSFEKLNAEGRLFFGSQLITLIEEVLPGRFGGDPTDYQLIEHEDAEGFTRFSVLVHPRLGALNDDDVITCVNETLGLTTGTRRDLVDAGTVRVRRICPVQTATGKLLPLHHLGHQAFHVLEGP